MSDNNENLLEPISKEFSDELRMRTIEDQSKTYKKIQNAMNRVGISDGKARAFITEIYKGSVPQLTINY